MGTITEDKLITNHDLIEALKTPPFTDFHQKIDHLRERFSAEPYINDLMASYIEFTDYWFEQYLDPEENEYRKDFENFKVELQLYYLSLLEDYLFDFSEEHGVDINHDLYKLLTNIKYLDDEIKAGISDLVDDYEYALDNDYNDEYSQE